MITRIIAFLGFISTIATIAFLKGKNNQQQKEIKSNYDNLKENTRINQEVKQKMDNSNFTDQSKLLRNKRRKNS